MGAETQVTALLEAEGCNPFGICLGVLVNGGGVRVERRLRRAAAHTLYNLIDRRRGRASTAITSNIELADWGHYLGDAVITTAVLDRLVMNVIRIDIDDPSYRQHVAKQCAKPKRSTANSDQ